MTSLRESARPLALSELTGRPDYLPRAHEVIAKIPAAADAAAVVALLAEATQRIGGDVAAWCGFIQEDDVRAAFRFFLACDPRWCIEYEQQGWYVDDPWLAYARSNPEPTLGHRIALATDAQARMVARAEEFGFRSTIIVPVQGGGGLTRVGMLCVGSSTPRFFEADGYGALRVVARTLATEVHDWWLRRVGEEFRSTCQMTREDLRLLSGTRNGLNAKELARQLRKSPVAVDCRFQRINAKLGVRDRRTAARLAAEYGLI